MAKRVTGKVKRETMNRMKQNIRTTILLITFIFISLGSIAAKGNLTDIKPGMNQEEVLKLLGKPKLKSFNENGEFWEYRKTISSENGEAIRVIATITFKEGLVTELHSEEQEPNEDQANQAASTAQAISATASLLQEIVHATSSGGRPHSRAMNEDRFNQFYANVKDRTFDSDKKREIASGSVNNLFTCYQCARLAKLLTFDSDKMAVVEMLAGKIIDKENSRSIEECFTFESDKKKVRQALMSATTPTHSSGSRGERGMNEDQFNLFLSNIKDTSFDSEKLKVLGKGVANNKFTCNQASRLITLFSFDSDKMKAVNSLAGHILDKENSRQIESCFTFDSDKRKVREALGVN
ncbi:MAG: DUF4476 domain-containing protein [Phocaeicola sp.]